MKNRLTNERGAATSFMVLVIGLTLSAMAVRGPLVNLATSLTDSAETAATVGEATVSAEAPPEASSSVAGGALGAAAPNPDDAGVSYSANLGANFGGAASNRLRTQHQSSRNRLGPLRQRHGGRLRTPAQPLIHVCERKRLPAQWGFLLGMLPIYIPCADPCRPGL